MSVIDNSGPIQGSQPPGEIQGGGPVESPYGHDGWYPIFAVAVDGEDDERRVLEVVDWVGGTGEKPDLGYLGAAGIVETAAEAVNIRGPGGAVAIWGQILGTLGDQPDLQAVLDAKANDSAVQASLTSLGDAISEVAGDLDTAETAISTLQDALAALTTVVAGKEPAFTKNTAFNKDFGTGSGQVAEGDHSHSAATEGTPGLVELATAGETTAGTDNGRAVSPAGLAESVFGQKPVSIVLANNETDAGVGDGVGKFNYTVPEHLNGWNLVAAHAAVDIAGTTGTLDIQLHNVTQAVDMLSTVITVDSGELTSYSAAVAPVVDGANNAVTTGDKIRTDIDAIHTTPSKGLQVILTFQKPNE